MDLQQMRIQDDYLTTSNGSWVALSTYSKGSSLKAMNKRIEEVYNDAGQLVGNITVQDGQACLFKQVVRYKHMLKVPPGWATDVTHLSELMIFASDEGLDPDKALIILTDEQLVRWVATVQQFMEKGFIIERGFGPQRVLPEAEWETSWNGRIREEPLFNTGYVLPANEQLRLL